MIKQDLLYRKCFTFRAVLAGQDVCKVIENNRSVV